jgi:hypothetical protein
MAAADGILGTWQLDIGLGAGVCPPHDQNLDLPLHKDLPGEGEPETNLAQFDKIPFAEPALGDLLAVDYYPIPTSKIGNGEGTVASHVDFCVMPGNAVVRKDDVVVATPSNAAGRLVDRHPGRFGILHDEIGERGVLGGRSGSGWCFDK